MKTALPLLSQIKIASPCTASWDGMAGDDRSRFCGHCEKHVYNFSEMTSPEIESLVREKEGRLCARYYQRYDGTVLTADCPVGLHHRVRARRRRSGVLTAALSSFFLSGCIGNNEPREGGGDPVDVIKTLFGGRQPNPPQPIAGGLCPPVEPQPMLMGEVCPPKDARPVEGGPAPRLAPPTAQE